MGAILRKLERPRAVRRFLKPISRAQVFERDKGRLFDGVAPNKECAFRRRVLMSQWDRLVRYYRAEQDPQRLLKWLRRCYIEVPREALRGSGSMKFIEALNEARSYENKARSHASQTL